VHVALDVQIVYLLNSQQKVSGRGQMGECLSNECRDSAERVEAIYNVNQSFFLVGGIAGTGLDSLGHTMDAVSDIAMSNCHIRVRVEADNDGASRQRIR
jgi:hypothetical protein